MWLLRRSDSRGLRVTVRTFLIMLQGDGYMDTGCYNLNQDCPDGSEGFVQVSSKVLLGGSISPPSEADSDQYEIKLRVFKVFLSPHRFSI